MISRLLIITGLLVLPCVLHAEERRVYITMPTVCHQIEKIEENKVYLRSPDEVCIQVPRKKDIKLDKKYNTVQIYIDGKYSHDEKVMEGFDMDSLRDYMQRTDEYKQKLEKSDMFKQQPWLKDKESQEKAKEVYEVFRSEEFQRKIKEETEKLKSGLFKEYARKAEKYYSDIKEDNKQTERYSWLSESKIFIMISKSVPLETLRNYVKSIDAMRLNAVLVMRGFVGGVSKILPTVKFVMDVIKKDPLCKWSPDSPCETYNTGVIIDPTLFQEYKIEKVPAIVIAKGIPEGNASPKEAYILSGDVSLEYAIEKVDSFLRKR